MLRIWLVFLATLAACGGNPVPTDPSKPPPLPDEPAAPVQGTVVNRFGEPVSGARVRIGTASPVTTDAQGKFTVRAVAATYDVAAVVDDPAVPPGFPPVSRAVVYQKLTRRDPVLYLPGLVVQPGSEIHSTVVQSVTTTPTSAFPLLWAFTNASRVVAVGLGTGVPGNFTWNGPAGAVNPGSLVAMLNSSSGVEASGHVLVTEGTGPLSVTVPVTAAPSLTLTGTSRPPAGCAIVIQDLVVPGSDGTMVVTSELFVNGQTGAAVAFNWSVGFTTEVPLSLRIPAICEPSSATSLVARRLSPSTTTFNLDVPAPPVITNPPSGGTTSSTAPLTWTAPAGSVSVLHFDHVESNGFISGTLDLATTSRSASVPDLTALGAKIVRGVGIRWRVEAWGGLTGIDALADKNGFGALLAGTGNFSQGVSESSSVAIAP
ncbi:MAG: carboxypeptidase-like regulatory domain-containing protein [Myxococcales bacterium]